MLWAQEQSKVSIGQDRIGDEADIRVLTNIFPEFLLRLCLAGPVDVPATLGGVRGRSPRSVDGLLIPGVGVDGELDARLGVGGSGG